MDLPQPPDAKVEHYHRPSPLADLRFAGGSVILW